MHDKVIVPDASLIYALPNDVFTLMFARFHRPVIIHSGTILMKLAQQFQLFVKKGLSLLINFYPAQCEFLLFDSGTMVIYQIVNFDSPADLLYDLMSVVVRFGDDQPLKKIWYIGKIEENDEEIIAIKSQFGKKICESWKYRPFEKLTKASGNQGCVFANLLSLSL